MRPQVLDLLGPSRQKALDLAPTNVGLGKSRVAETGGVVLPCLCVGVSFLRLSSTLLWLEATKRK